MDPEFVYKIESTFHKSQDIILPTFCQNATNEKEREFHMLDVKRCLLAYLEATEQFRI